MDTVFVERLALRGKHGVHHRERLEDQDFIINISAEFDTQLASKSDRLADTLDYRHFCEIARDAVENKSFDLIEKLGDVIAAGILEDTRITRVTITIRKPEALKNGIPGVTITRTRL